MLNGGGGLNPDGLALDLQFAADKAYSINPAAADGFLVTAKKGPSPAFSRASAATFVGSTGLIEYANENLIQQSSRLDLSPWVQNGTSTVSTGELAPDGSTDACLITAASTNGGRTQGARSTSIGVSHVFSCHVKQGTATAVRLTFFDGLSSLTVNLNWSNFVVSTASGTIPYTSSLFPLPNGWYRWSIAFSSTATSTGANFGVTAGGTGGTFIAWGAQLERASSVRTYIPTTTSIRYAPRFDHDPVTLASRGLLIEESRTNLLTQSETWSSGANFTGPSAPTVTPDTTNAPNGALTADTLTGSTGTATDGSVTSTWRLPTVSSSTAYTFSIYVRSLGVATKAEIRIRDNSTGASVQTLDTTLTSSWKRLSVTATTGGTTTSIRCIIQNTDGPIAIWGAQLEAGSFPTSYIPTTTGSVVRSADVCSITGADFTGFFNSSAGTLLSEAMIANLVGSNRGIAQIDNTTNVTIIRHVYSFPDGGFRSAIRASADGETVLSTVAGTASVIQKRVIAYEGTSFASATNGGAVTTATRTAPAGLNAMRIGSLASGLFPLTGHIAAIRYYRKRLPNAKLVTLTT